MKKIIFLLILGAIFTFFAVIFSEKKERTTVKIKESVFQAEKATSPAEIEKGLGGKADMKENEAMLFIFPSSGKYGFWMKEMRFDLDVIWIRNGKIIYIAENLITF